MKVLHVSAECYPVAKVGGLADVVGALPRYQQNSGWESQVIMPYYDNAYIGNHKFKLAFKSTLKLGKKKYSYKIMVPAKNSLGFKLFLVDIKELLFKDYVYSSDDTERFLAFQIAVLDWVLDQKTKPDILHCHDHHTGLIPFMMSHAFKYAELKETPSVLTIHNAQYQGWFSYDKIGLIPEFDPKNTGLLDWNRTLNSLAAAIKCAWKVTTVSPGYMEELKFSANGLESLINHESSKCQGILNGIDPEVWNPETDGYLIKNYKLRNVQTGKKANKEWLCKKFNLDPKKPLFVFIGRLVGEKGADLFPEVFESVLKKKEVSILLLGSGNETTEARLEELKANHRGNYNADIGYNEKLSHIMYAGGDFLLMPSRVEPCGLNQMYSLRYGTIPIVNNIGGLKDTIVDISEKGFGFVHNGATVKEISNAISRATYFYKDQIEFKRIRNLIMRIDHSWDASAKAYVNLYKTLINKS